MGGSFSVSTSNGYISGTVQWSESNINTSNNTSQVTATMYLSRTNTGYTSSGTDSFYVTINGQQFNNTLSYNLTYNSNTQMVTGTATVTHNSDGTKSITIGWGGGGGSGGVFTVNASSGTATLTTIARASTISSGVYWTAGTQNLGVTLSVYDSSYHHTLTLEVQNPQGTWTIVNTWTGVGSSTTLNFSVADITKMYSWIATGTSCPATLYCDTYDSGGNHIGSQTNKSGTCYAATPSTPSMPDMNIEDTGTITLSPPTATTGSFTQTIQFSWGSLNGGYLPTIASGVTGTSTSWNTLGTDSGNGGTYASHLYAQIPTSNAGWGRLICTTYYNGQQVQNPVQSGAINLYVVVSKNVPQFSSGATYKDINSTTVGITGNNQYIVQNQSTLEVDLPISAAATAKNSAYMSYYIATVGNNSQTINVPGKAPTLSLSANSGSTLTATTYYVKYTWVNGAGIESFASPEASIAVTSGNNLVVTIPSVPSGSLSANIYVSTTSGSETKQGNTSGTTYTLSSNPTTGGGALPTNIPFSLGTVSASSNTTVSLQAYDSRGNSTPVNLPITVVPYQPPVISASAKRNNNFDANTVVSLSGSFSPITVGTDKNALTTPSGSPGPVTYQYEKTTDSGYNALTAFAYQTPSSGQYTTTSVTLTLDNTASWNVKLSVSDKLSTTTAVLVVSSGSPIVFLDTSKGSVGIGKFPVNSGTLESKGSIHTDADIYANWVYGNAGVDLTLQPASNQKTVVNGNLSVVGYVQQSGNELLPPGIFFPYGGGSAPAGYLLCDGSAVSRTTYSRLFSAIGTAYGSGDGSTTFNVPNLCGRIPVGLWSGDTDWNALGKTGGEKNHTLTTGEMPTHAHNTSSNLVNAQGSGNKTSVASGTTYGFAYGSTYSTDSQGGGGPHNNMQPYIIVNYIIKV